MRLFVAAGIPEAYRVSLAAALDPLKPQLTGVRWTRTESWHVTLKFLGEVPETQLDEVQEVLEDVVSRVGAFETRLTAPGAFPSVKRLRVLWMGLGDDDHAFRNLAGRTDRKFEKAGFPPEGRPFRPHITLARAGGSPSQPVGRLVEELSAKPLDRSPFRVGELTLYRSRLSPKGPEYEPVLILPLPLKQEKKGGS